MRVFQIVWISVLIAVKVVVAAVAGEVEFSGCSFGLQGVKCQKRVLEKCPVLSQFLSRLSFARSRSLCDSPDSALSH